MYILLLAAGRCAALPLLVPVCALPDPSHYLILSVAKRVLRAAIVFLMVTEKLIAYLPYLLLVGDGI